MATVVRLAAVSKGDFYRIFADLSRCVEATHEVAVNAFFARIDLGSPSGSCAAATTPALTLRHFLTEEKGLAWVLVDPTLLSLRAVARERSLMVGYLAERLAGGGLPSHLAPHVVRGAAGALARVLPGHPPRPSAVGSDDLIDLLCEILDGRWPHAPPSR